MTTLTMQLEGFLDFVKGIGEWRQDRRPEINDSKQSRKHANDLRRMSSAFNFALASGVKAF